MKGKIIKIAKELIKINEELLRLSEKSFYKRGQGEGDLLNKWYNIGIEAGKEEDWMNLEDFDESELSKARDEVDLIILAIDNWEQTDHYNILYGKKMQNDAVERVKEESGEIDYDRMIEVLNDLKDAFWVGYIKGRKEGKGIDIYREAKEALRKYKEKMGYL